MGGGNGGREKEGKTEEKLTAGGSFHLPGNEKQQTTVEAGTVILSPNLLQNATMSHNSVWCVANRHGLHLLKTWRREKNNIEHSFIFIRVSYFFILFFLDVLGD